MLAQEGESSAGRNSGRKWKKTFPAKVSGSERLVHYNGLMDPPGCLLSLRYIGGMLTKVAGRVGHFRCLRPAVSTLPFNGAGRWRRKGKNNLQSLVEILYLLQLLCLHLKGSVKRLVPSAAQDMSLGGLVGGLACFRAKSRSASVNYSPANEEASSHLSIPAALLKKNPPVPPMHSMHCISPAPPSLFKLGGVKLQEES